MIRTAMGLLLACLLSTAAAHEIGVSQGRYVREGATLRAELAFAPGELLLALPELDADADRELSVAEVAAAQPTLQVALARDLPLHSASAPCRLVRVHAAPGATDGVRIRADYFCRDPDAEWVLQFALLDRLTLGHRHLATIEVAGSAQPEVLHASQRTMRVPARDARVVSSNAFVPMVAFGLEHILTGYDHLVFLLGLVILGGRWRDMLAAVTAFTLAHSITLALAALQWVTPAAGLIEPAIALSIAWVGLENWRGVELRRRWRLTFAFGLIHGFGFAGALGEVAITPEALPRSLLAFNLGVEAGQLAVLAALLPVLHALRRSARFGRVSIVTLNVAIVLAGLGWFVQRVAGL